MRLLLVACSAVLVVGCAKTAGGKGPELYVEVREGGACGVRGVEMPCKEVPQYLRDKLKVPMTAFIAVTIARDSKIPLEAMTPVMTDLEAAGYNKVIGSVEV